MAGMAERFVIPDDLARAAAREGRDDWLAELPALVLQPHLETIDSALVMEPPGAGLVAAAPA